MEVGCAIIYSHSADKRDLRLLVAQRMPGSYLGGFWEFPGGKRHDGETFEECLVREVKEELGVEIFPTHFYQRVEHVYPDRIVDLHFYFCKFMAGRPARKECFDFAWIRIEDFKCYRFLPADQDILNDLSKLKGWYFGKGL